MHWNVCKQCWRRRSYAGLAGERKEKHSTGIRQSQYIKALLLGPWFGFKANDAGYLPSSDTLMLSRRFPFFMRQSEKISIWLSNLQFMASAVKQVKKAKNFSARAIASWSSTAHSQFISEGAKYHKIRIQCLLSAVNCSMRKEWN